jgi:pimeloyl-ACP methyl ester carboxylesterase
MAPSDPSRPTVVLVHGAFAESASWSGVVPVLQDAGCTVVAAANPLRGVASDAASLRAQLDALEGPIVLVGHSYGGAVASSAAAGSDAVKALVYVAAFSPEEGESCGDLAGRFPGSTLGETLVPAPLADGGTDLRISPDRFQAQFCHDVDEATANLMAVTQRPITEAALGEAAKAAAWKTIPSWFVFGTEDRNIPVASLRFMAERAGSKGTVEVDGASHALGVSTPGKVAEVILQAVEAV